MLMTGVLIVLVGWLSDDALPYKIHSANGTFPRRVRDHFRMHFACIEDCRSALWRAHTGCSPPSRRWHPIVTRLHRWRTVVHPTAHPRHFGSHFLHAVLAT